MIKLFLTGGKWNKLEASWKFEALRLKGQLGRVDLRFRDFSTR